MLYGRDRQDEIADFELTSPSSEQCLRLSRREHRWDSGRETRVDYRLHSFPAKEAVEECSSGLRKEEGRNEIRQLRYKPDFMARSLRGYVPTIQITDLYSGFEAFPVKFQVPRHRQVELSIV